MQSGLLTNSGGMSTLFGRSGPVVSVLGTAVGFTLESVGNASALFVPRRSAPVASRDRVSYARGNGVTEWYRSGPLGLEQSFTLAHRPSGGSHAGPVTVALSVTGPLQPHLEGASIVFAGGGRSQPALRYGDLSVSDASGRRLPARLELAGSTIKIVVADRGAAYPIRIDPLIQQGAKLAPGLGNVASNSFFGLSVALSSDGSTALVGGPGDNAGPGEEAGGPGAVWVFSRSGGVWTQQGPKLTPGDESNGAFGAGGGFGSSVALSADGNTALIGGPFDDGDVGAACVFTRSDGVWEQQGAKLDGTGAVGIRDFGQSVALSADGNTALIGGGSDQNGIGAAWVFTLSAGVWTQQGAKLTGTGEVGTAAFGWSVALSVDGNTALIGGPADSSETGAAWVFTRSGGVWTQHVELVGGSESGGAQFGSSVALSSDASTALVSGPYDNSDAGAAWVFVQSGGIWSQQGGKLTGSDENNTNGGGLFGFAAALSGNGNAALIGGPNDGDPIGSRAPGAAWVFTRSGGVWAQLGSKLTPSDETNSPLGGGFGTSVALSTDGSTALGGGFYDHNSVGAAWVFTQSAGVWSQQGPKLVGLESAEAGLSVALSGDGNTALVGGPDASGGGAAWVFARSGTSWVLQRSISGCEGLFGSGLALSGNGNTAVIGCPGDATQPGGSAWVFTRSGATWTQQGGKLSPSDVDNSGGGASFGVEVALSADGNTALIGGPSDGSAYQGAAWVFTRSGGTWAQQGAKLTPSDEDNGGGGAGFGSSVALSADGNTALIGGPLDASTFAGAAWVFTRSGTTWTQQGAKLTPSDEDNGGDGGEFGFSVNLSADGNTALIGGPFDGASNAGAAWAFTRSGTIWTQQGPKLTPNDENNTPFPGWFGFAVALSADGNTAMIGGPLDDGFSGAAWLFGRSSGTWAQQGSKLTPSDEDNSGGGASFGFSVALSSNATTSLIGGPDDGTYDSGAAWVFYGDRAEVPPTNVAASGGSHLQATVSFTAPASNGGAAIGSYTVTSSPGGIQASGTPRARSRSPGSAMERATPSRLLPRTSLAPALPQAPRVERGPHQKRPRPGAPSVSAAAGDGQASIIVVPPASNGGRADDHCRTHREAPRPRAAKQGQGSSSPITVSGQSDGTTYTFTLGNRNANSAGTGPVPPHLQTRSHRRPPRAEAAAEWWWRRRERGRGRSARCAP